MDVKTTFLNGVIEDEAYIKQPKGFDTFDQISHVCGPKQAFYSLKKAPCAWYTKSIALTLVWASPKVKRVKTVTQ